jgi:hypothetical protein
MLRKYFRTNIIALVISSLFSVSVVSQAAADGINWTTRTSAADIAWISVTYGNGLFVAVSYSGTGNRVMTSPDGVTWTARTSAADNQWISVTYGNGLFVAVSRDGPGNRVMTSGEIGLAARIAAAKAAAAKTAEDAAAEQAAAAAKAMQDQALVLGTLALAIGSIESGLSTLTVAATQKQGVGTHKVSKKLKKKAKTKK